MVPFVDHRSFDHRAFDRRVSVGGDDLASHRLGDRFAGRLDDRGWHRRGTRRIDVVDQCDRSDAALFGGCGGSAIRGRQIDGALILSNRRPRCSGNPFGVVGSGSPMARISPAMARGVGTGLGQDKRRRREANSQAQGGHRGRPEERKEVTHGGGLRFWSEPMGGGKLGQKPGLAFPSAAAQSPLQSKSE